jgi:hypothetical protein
MERRSSQFVEENSVDMGRNDQSGGDEWPLNVAGAGGLMSVDRKPQGPITTRHLTVLSEATALTYLFGTKFIVVRILS